MNIKFIAPVSLLFFLLGINGHLNVLLITNVVSVLLLIILLLMSNL
ncbi:hypothetical protein R7P70_05060 [Vibrio sp. Vb0301]|nr:hypothetical protein [Vibrio sp. Vb0301]